MKKRFPAFFLALALCLGLAVPAFAADADTSIRFGVSMPEGFLNLGEQKMEFKQRLALDDGKLGEAEDVFSITFVAPASEYYLVLVAGLAESELDKLSVGALSDPDGDGIYIQRLFDHKTGAVAPIPEDGVYKSAGSGYYSGIAANMLPGFCDFGNGMYGFHAGQLHELFGDRTILFFFHEDYEEAIGGVFLSAGAFDDVPGVGWYSDKVAWAADQGITTGDGHGNFEPGRDCTQSQILTFLWRAEGKPGAAQAPVTVEEWYQDAINWAYEKGMIDDSFEGGEPCTRADAVSYIWQAKDKPPAAPGSFTDMEGYGEDYVMAVKWANEKKVAEGDGSGSFNPDAVCNRAMIATFLYRAYNN